MLKPIVAIKASFVAAALAAAVPAHADFLGGIVGGITRGVIGAGTNIVGQATGKIGSKITGGEELANLEEERAKFLETTEKQLAGVDSASRRQLQATAEKQWGLAENALLLKNLQAQQAKDAPLIDVGKALGAGMGGLAGGLGVNAALGGDVGSVLTGATLEGLVSGVTGADSGGGSAARLSASQMGLGGMGSSGSVGDAIGGAATSAAAGGLSKFVGKTVGGLFGGRAAGGQEFALSDGVLPSSFLGVAPSTLLGKDLYREHGFLGWKRIDGSQAQGAEAYAPVAGGSEVKAVVYNFDKKTGQMKAAFRILSASPADFTKVVQALDAKMGPSVYASTGATLRAVWPDGSFAAADESKVTVGWSELIPAVHAQAAK